MPRRRVDLMRLPAVWRYALALVVLAIVVALALLASGGDTSDQPSGWYGVVVRIGAIVLLAYCAFWLGRRVARGRRRH
jgi:Na+/melibiose symporter-like transporter